MRLIDADKLVESIQATLNTGKRRKRTLRRTVSATSVAIEFVVSGAGRKELNTMNRWTERFDSCSEKAIVIHNGSDFLDVCFEGEREYDAMDTLAEYEDLEEQGLLLKLPCKEAYSASGDTVYFIFDDEIVECVHCGLQICPVSGEGFISLAADEDIFPYRNPDPEHDLDPTDWCTSKIDANINEIGKTLFFTREEAEKKLKEMQNT